MKQYILIGFQSNPNAAAKVLKTFYNGGANAAIGAVAGIAGITSGKMEIKYSEGFEGAMTFEHENEAGLVQQALNSSFHGKYNSWCVRELVAGKAMIDYVKEYCKSNKHIKMYAKFLAENQ